MYLSLFSKEIFVWHAPNLTKKKKKKKMTMMMKMKMQVGFGLAQPYMDCILYTWKLHTWTWDWSP